MTRMRNLIWIFIIGAFLITGCNTDEEPVNNGSIDLVGEWTATEVSVGMTVNGTPYVQWLQDAQDLTEAQAQEYADLFTEELAGGMQGTITFNEDNSYSLKFGDDPVETGTWLFTNNNQTLTLTESTPDSATSDDAMELEVISLTATTLVVGVEELEIDDMNDDGIEDELVISLELTLVK